MELVPYPERRDKYRSVGIAFAIGANRYVSAGHVLALGMGSRYGPPASLNNISWTSFWVTSSGKPCDNRACGLSNRRDSL